MLPFSSTSRISCKMKIHKTKAGIAICPFFSWQSENIEGCGRHEENDVNLTYCDHIDNPDDYEGNCQEKYCPLVEMNRAITRVEKLKELS